MPPMNKCVLSALCFLFFSSFAWTQETFQFTTAKKKQRLTFELINNLIVIPVRVNGARVARAGGGLHADVLLCSRGEEEQQVSALSP